MDECHGEGDLIDWPPVISLTQDDHEESSAGSGHNSSSSQTTKKSAKKSKKQSTKEKNRKRREGRKARKRELARIQDGPIQGTTGDSVPANYPLRFLGRTLFTFRRNLKKKKNGMVTYVCPDFDVEDTIRNSRKAQPVCNKDPGFEIANEPRLKLVAGEIVTLSDLNGVPCVIKVGGGKVTPLNEGLFQAVEEYASTRHLSDDPIRHGQMGANLECREIWPCEHTDATPHGSNCSTMAGNRDVRTSAARGCIRIHRRFAARMDNKTHNIKLGQGPAETYRSKGDIIALRNFAAKLLPLTQLVEAIYSVFLPDEFVKYKKVFDFLNGPEPDLEDCAFGVWTSRSLVLDALSSIHRDLEDVCRGWCVLVPCGNFRGGDACFPSLGVKLEIPVGTVVFMRSYAIEHYIGAFTGTRYSIVHFTHQSVHDFYTQEKQELLWGGHEMPVWWETSRETLITAVRRKDYK